MLPLHNLSRTHIAQSLPNTAYVRLMGLHQNVKIADSLSLLSPPPVAINELQSMSWLARSLANSLRLDDNDESAVIDHHHHHRTSTSKPDSPSSSSSSPSSPTPAAATTHHDEQDHEDPSKGVKDDLSEFKQTLARQLFGVASFLAPPSTPSNSHPVDSELNNHHNEPSSDVQYDDDADASDSPDGVAIRRNLSGEAETGISSQNVEEDEDDEEEEYEYRNAVGVTEEVLTFAMNIAMHPETWLDFPIEEEDDLEDFNMSETQHHHALAVEHLTPRLAALRIELCPCHMSDGYFWKVYFVLLHSRLNKHDAELLLTPQIKAARALWMHELQKKTKQEQEWSRKEAANVRVRDFYDDYPPSSYYDTSYEEDMPLESLSSESASISGTQDFETEKHPIIVTEMQIIDKSVIKETSIDEKKIIVGPSPNLLLHKYDEDDEDEDDWLNDEDMKIDGFGATILIDDEEDVSFSDLEDDDDIIMPIVSKSYNRY